MNARGRPGRARRRRAARQSAATTPWAATSSAGCSGVLLLLVVSAITFLIFYVLPSADPAGCGPAATPTPELDRGDPRAARARQAAADAVLELPEGAGPALRLRQLLRNDESGRRRSSTASRTRSRSSLGAASSGFTIGVIIGIDLRGRARHAPRPLRDGRRADLDLRARLLARARRALPLRRATSAASRSSPAPAPTRIAARPLRQGPRR